MGRYCGRDVAEGDVVGVISEDKQVIAADAAGLLRTTQCIDGVASEIVARAARAADQRVVPTARAGEHSLAVTRKDIEAVYATDNDVVAAGGVVQQPVSLELIAKQRRLSRLRENALAADHVVVPALCVHESLGVAEGCVRAVVPTDEHVVAAGGVDEVGRITRRPVGAVVAAAQGVATAVADDGVVGAVIAGESVVGRRAD